MGNSTVTGWKPYGSGVDMKSLKALTAFSLLHSFGGIESIFIGVPQGNKPNRVSQKKRRLNQRRKGK